MKFVKKVWEDQVGSKVLANIITSGIFFIFSQIGIFLIGLYNNSNFIDIYKNLPSILKELFSNRGWIIITIVSLITLLILILIFFKLKRFIINYLKKQFEKDEEEIEIRDAPTVFFNKRFRDAFPGFSNEFKSFESRREIHKRLKFY